MFEAEQRRRVYLTLVGPARVHQFHVSLELGLRLERHVALGLALLVRADEVTLREVNFQRVVVLVVHVLELVVGAQVARQVGSLQVVHEGELIEVVLLAEVAPGVGQDLGTPLVGGVSVLDVLAELLDVVDSVFANEDGAALETDFAESFLVHGLEVASERLDIRESLRRVAIVHQTLQRAKLHPRGFSPCILVVDRLILFVLDCVFRVEFVPGERRVITDHNFVQLLLANAALGLLQQQANSQSTLVAHRLMVALSHSEVNDRLQTQEAVLADTLELFFSLSFCLKL